MPSPEEHYTTFQESLRDVFKREAKEESLPCLFAIQSLNGRTAAEKHKEFNKLIKSAMQKIENKHENIEPHDIRGISDGLVPLARAIIANKLKVSETLTKSLQSNDVIVKRKVLKSRWFFHAASEHVNVIYFKQHIMPYVSVKHRCTIASMLSYGLVGNEEKAENFFKLFTDMYGYKVGVPILLACSDDFIYKKILEHKIILSRNVFNRLYATKPNVAIKYLQLAKNKNNKNVRIYMYNAILPKLIEKYPEVFVELYELIPKSRLKLSNKKAAMFLKNLKGTLIEKPKMYLKILPLKLVHKNLNKAEFDQMFENSFPDEEDNFYFKCMFEYIKDYKYGCKWELLKSKYKKVYQSDFPTEKSLELDNDLILAKLIPNEERSALGLDLMVKYKDDDNLFKNIMQYLEPKKLLILIKDKIKEMADWNDRAQAFSSMICSCYLYSDPNTFLEFLEYYYKYHKNETTTLLCNLISKMSILKWDCLDVKHWNILINIIKYILARDESAIIYINGIEWVLKNALRDCLNDEDNNSSIINDILTFQVILNVEHYHRWNIFKGEPILEKRVFEKLLQMTSSVYPPNHCIWDDCKKMSVALKVVRELVDYNNNLRTSKKIQKNAIAHIENESKKLKIENYPWLLSIVETLLLRGIGSNQLRLLKQILKDNFPYFYYARVPSEDKIEDIDSGSAINLLKKNPQKILDHWECYAVEAATKLSRCNTAAKRFVAATRWHSDIPVRFLEISVSRVLDEGFIIILGILLDGEGLVKFTDHIFEANDLGNIDPTTASEAKFRSVKNILLAMRYSNPPIPLSHLLKFRTADFVKYTDSILISLSNSVNCEQMKHFALQWAKSKCISVKKQGIRLYIRIAEIDDIVKLFKEIYLSEKSSGLLLDVTKIVLELFEELPRSSTWALVKDSLRNLTVDNLLNLSSLFTNLDMIHTNYLSDYVNEFLDTLDELSTKGLKEKCKYSTVSLLIENLNPVHTSLLTQTLVMRILNQYFFNVDSPDVSSVTQRFAIVSYLLPAKDDFEDRLQTIVDKFHLICEQYDKSDSKNAKYYPSKDAIQTIGEYLTTELEQEHSLDKNIRIINSFINVLNTSLEPHQALSFSMNLNFYIEYLSSTSPQDFGSRCIRRAHNYLETFSELIIQLIKEIISKIISKRKKSTDYRLAVVEELVRGGDRVGCLIAIMLLDELELESSNFDKRYDLLILELLKFNDVSVKAYLDMHLCEVTRYHV